MKRGRKLPREAARCLREDGQPAEEEALAESDPEEDDDGEGEEPPKKALQKPAGAMKRPAANL
eukprot:8423545-Alexandrium_andersonii.AAC.1